MLGAKGTPAVGRPSRAPRPGRCDASRSVWALVLAQEKRSKLRRGSPGGTPGAFVLCDRYPQAQVPGIIDGPLLDAWLSSGSRWRRAAGEVGTAALRQAHALQPDLVIRLLVDDETAARRRPGHDPDELASRKRVVEELRFDRAALGVVEVDANRPFDSVFVEARAAMAERLPTCRWHDMIIELCGVPGAGKSTVAHALVTELRRRGHAASLPIEEVSPADRAGIGCAASSAVPPSRSPATPASARTVRAVIRSDQPDIGDVRSGH